MIETSQDKTSDEAPRAIFALRFFVVIYHFWEQLMSSHNCNVIAGCVEFLVSWDINLGWHLGFRIRISCPPFYLSEMGEQWCTTLPNVHLSIYLWTNIYISSDDILDIFSSPVSRLLTNISREFKCSCYKWQLFILTPIFWILLYWTYKLNKFPMM